jgi:CheY-like chemotaxis protein
MRALIAEDEPIFRLDIAQRLVRLGFTTVVECDRAADAVDHAERDAFDLILLDIRLQDEMTGVEAAESIAARSDTPIIIMSAYRETEDALRIRIPTLVAFLSKPVSDVHLETAIGRAQSPHREDRYPVVRIWADEDNVTHIEDGWIPMSPGGPIGLLSDAIDANAVIFRSTGADYDYDWHPTPARQFIFMMSGEIEIEAGDGAIRRVQAGETLFLEDTVPPGHRTRNVGSTPRYSVFVQTDAPVPYQRSE